MSEKPLPVLWGGEAAELTALQQEAMGPMRAHLKACSAQVQCIPLEPSDAPFSSILPLVNPQAAPPTAPQGPKPK